MPKQINNKTFIVSLDTTVDEEDLTFEMTVTGVLYNSGEFRTSNIECTTIDGCEFMFANDIDLQSTFNLWLDDFYSELMYNEYTSSVSMEVL